MNESENILVKVEEFVLDILTAKLPAQYTYHSLEHTRDVVMRKSSLMPCRQLIAIARSVCLR